MINGCLINGVHVSFLNETASSDKNIYTTVVGRNGSGKSRMLRGLISSFIPREHYRESIQDDVIVNSTFFEGVPKKIIAVSTSPFDKFPYEPYFSSDGHEVARVGYSYLGLKGISNENFWSRLFKPYHWCFDARHD